MSGFTVEFAFEIGQQVYFRDAEHSLTQTPTAFTVLERRAQQCPGGIQLHYVLVGHDKPILELALTAQMPAYRPQSPERTAERRRLQDEETMHRWSSLAAKSTEKAG